MSELDPLHSTFQIPHSRDPAQCVPQKLESDKVGGAVELFSWLKPTFTCFPQLRMAFADGAHPASPPLGRVARLFSVTTLIEFNLAPYRQVPGQVACLMLVSM